MNKVESGTIEEFILNNDNKSKWRIKLETNIIKGRKLISEHNTPVICCLCVTNFLVFMTYGDL